MSIDPQLSFDDHAASYDVDLHRGLALSGETKEYFARGRVARVADRLALLRHPVESVLDYGCGDGSTAPLLGGLLQAGSVTGVDTSGGLLAQAREAYGSESVSFFPLEEAVPDGDHDLAFCNGVFHHIPPRERSLAVGYVWESLRPGAMFAFWENNPWNPGTRWVMSRIPFDRDAITIPPPEGRRLLTAGGFEILATDFMFFFPRFLAWFRPLERHLAGWPLGAQYLILARKPAP